MRRIDTLIEQIDLSEIQTEIPANNWVEKRLVWHEDLIHPDWKAWFASRFVLLTPHLVDYLASTARTDGLHRRKYFSWLIEHHTKQKDGDH